MTTEPLPTEATREGLLTLLDDLSSRGMASDFNIGVPNVGALNNPTQWKGAIERATPFELRAIGQALGTIETKILQREKRDAGWAQDDARRERTRQPLSADDPEYIAQQQLADDAKKAAAYRASVGGQLEELIRLNQRVVELLERQQAKP